VRFRSECKPLCGRDNGGGSASGTCKTQHSNQPALCVRSGLLLGTVTGPRRRRLRDRAILHSQPSLRPPPDWVPISSGWTVSFSQSAIHRGDARIRYPVQPVLQVQRVSVIQAPPPGRPACVLDCLSDGVCISICTCTCTSTSTCTATLALAVSASCLWTIWGRCTHT